MMLEYWAAQGVPGRCAARTSKYGFSPRPRANPARGIKPCMFIPHDKPEPSGLTCDVAIIGGGLGGMALAGALQSRGFDAHVYEAAAQARMETSTLIGVGANALKALESLHPSNVEQVKARGCQRQVLTRTVRAHRAHNVMTQSFPVSGSPYIGIRWSQMQDLLASQVPSAALHCGYRAVGYTEENSQVRVHFKDKEDVVARLVVAADGLRSALRCIMVPNDPGPRFLGQMNWSALIHNPDNSIVEAHEPGELQVFRNHQNQTKETMAGIVSDAGAGYTFWSVSVHSETRDYTDKSRPGGLGCPGSKARVINMLADVGWDGPLSIVQATPEPSIFERAIMDRVPLDELGATMTSPGGRVVLLGDAAHAMHPKVGQGGRTAFEDADTLTKLLEQHRDKLCGWQTINTHGITKVVLAHATPVGASFATSNGSVATATLNGLMPTGLFAADGEVLKEIASSYTMARKTRTCRVQRFSSESCGMSTIREAAVAMSGASKEDVQSPDRHLELLRWLDQYPNNLSGDPESQFWKPMETAVDIRMLPRT